MAVSQCIKFHLILFYTFSYALDKFNIAKNRKGNNSINTDDRVMVLAICTFLIALYHCIKFHIFILKIPFSDMIRTSLLLQKLGREINSVIVI